MCQLVGTYLRTHSLWYSAKLFCCSTISLSREDKNVQNVIQVQQIKSHMYIYNNKQYIKFGVMVSVEGLQGCTNLLENSVAHILKAFCLLEIIELYIYSKFNFLITNNGAV